MSQRAMMANENQNSEDAGELDSGDEPKPKKDPHLERAIKERDAAKAKLREREDKSAELAELKARLAEIDAEKEKAAIEEEKKRNDFTAQTQRWQKELEKERSEKAEALAQLDVRLKNDRETALVDAVAGKAGISRTLAKGLLRVARDTGFDNAPEQLDDDYVADAIKKLRELEPDMFKPRTSGAGNPGINTKTKSPAEDPNEDPKRAQARAAAQALSPLQRRKE